MKATQMTQAVIRAARRLDWGHNALRRRTDRIEIATLVGAIVLTVAAVPLALLVDSVVYQHDLGLSAEQTAARHQVTATLLEGTSTEPGWGGLVANVSANARWTGLDGSSHTGVIQAQQAATAGTKVGIWTDAHGNLADPPLTPAQAWGRGAMAFVIAMTVAVAALTAVVGLVRRRLNRIRYAAWDVEWQQIDPWRTRY